ncbi:dihydrouridine synthase TIM-barrel protein nifR3 [Listeria innocua FSL S4-378]|nr:dihydrouridine synthase TIM-barrel protein nifR3 [Listeria innocua FSL S4-378]
MFSPGTNVINSTLSCLPIIISADLSNSRAASPCVPIIIATGISISSLKRGYEASINTNAKTVPTFLY